MAERHFSVAKTKSFHAGIWTRVLWVKTTYPNQLDYAEAVNLNHPKHSPTLRFTKFQLDYVKVIIWTT
jgi:hypothetical protein